MTTTANTRKTMRKTLKPMLHFRQGEKLGLGSGAVPMLFPAPALDDPQGQEQEKEREADKQHDRAGVNHPAGEIVHLLKNGDRRQDLALPAGAATQSIRQHHDQKNRLTA